jgi:uncharacterized protein (DUF488 family)
MDTIYTIGHGKRSFGEVREQLERHGVAMIVDVRSHPTSRHAPDYRKQALEAAAAAAGFGYRWMGAALGGRPDDPALLAEGGEPDWCAVARSPQFRSAIVDLLALAEEAPVAVLCAEASPDHCHRSAVIAPALTAAGARVVHLLPGGEAAPHQEGLGI